MKIEKDIFDEHGCFEISDFRKGDNIIVTNRKRERVKGIVISVNRRPPTINFKDHAGVVHTARLNDISFLQDPVPGWLDK